MLTFSEDIEPTSVNVTGITIQSTAGVVTNTSLYYRLTSAQSVSVTTNTIVRIVLSGEDYGALQLRPGVATSRSNTFLTMDPITVTDRSTRPNMVQPIVAGINAQQVSTFVQDTTPPTLLSFSLDLNTGTMTLTFDEPVLTGSFSPQQVLISSHRDSAVGASYRLTGGLVTNSNIIASSVIEVSLSVLDLQSLKHDRSLATGPFNTYLSASMGLVTDTNRNNNSMSYGLAVSRFTPDTTPPELLFFTVDLNRGLLVLTFNDVINASSFNASAITLQSSPARQEMQWYTLTQSSTSSPDGPQIIASLSSEDLNVIKSIPTLCTEVLNCFITISQSIASDLSGLNTIPIPDESALPAAAFIDDSTRPELISWDLDLNRATMTLAFSEIVNISSFDISGLTLVNGHLFDNDGDLQPTSSYTLTDSSLQNGFNSPVVIIVLSQHDLDAIIAINDLATSPSDTYIIATPRTVVDMVQNQLARISLTDPLQVSVYGKYKLAHQSHTLCF